MSLRSALKKALQDKFKNINKETADIDDDNDNDWN